MQKSLEAQYHITNTVDIYYCSMKSENTKTNID